MSSSSGSGGEEGTSEAGEEQTILWTTWRSARSSCPSSLIVL